MKPSFLLSLPLVVILAVGCEGDAGPQEVSQWVDLFTPRAEPSRLVDTPLMVMGATDTLPLARVTGAVFLGDGIAVANSRYNQVLIFDEQGRLVTTQGRQGQGPGEYMNLGGVIRHGGGLVTWDQYSGRVTLLDAQGRYSGDSMIGLRTGRLARIVGAFGSSVLVEFRSQGFPGEGDVEPSRVRTDRQYEIVDLRDGTVTFETSLPGEERWVAREGTRHSGLPLIFGRSAVAAVAHDRAYLATTDSLTLAAYDELGNQETVALGHGGLAAPERWAQVVRDTIRSFIEETSDRLSSESRLVMRSVEFNLALLADLPARSTLPSFSGIQGAADGRLWIRSYADPMQEHQMWVALDAAWVPEQWVEMPTNLHVLDLSQDRVLVLEKGEFGVDLVKVYGINP